MMSNSNILNFGIIILVTVINNSIGESFNQPKFGPNATWNSNAETFANTTIIGVTPNNIFIDTNNTIYIPVSSTYCVQVWLEEDTIPTSNYSTLPQYPYSTFVTSNGNLYVSTSSKIDRWPLNANSSSTVIYTINSCYSLFIDINDNLYCSYDTFHLVIKISFNESTYLTEIVAGNGTFGSDSYTLNEPRGIFVDRNLNVYVADCVNNRIQLFYFGELNGTTLLLGSSINLNYPSGITFDGDGCLFIADCNNHRIVGSSSNGFYCAVGCSGVAGSSSNQLNQPEALSFDSYGNLFVADTYNNRIQKFLLKSNSSSVVTTTSQISTSMTMRPSSERIQSTAIGPIFTVAFNVSLILGELDNSTNSVQYTASLIVTSISTPNIFPNQTAQQSSLPFIVSTCANASTIGSYCNITNTPCHILQPCQNHANCTDNSIISHGYTCSCLPGFNGTQCQFNHRPCQSDTCWNRG
ncbi:hypothetical protein I4U23_020133 [Adineta vaga]|nr:hypothetical protein I4U23_020133 [Adineta vaga]